MEEKNPQVANSKNINNFVRNMGLGIPRQISYGVLALILVSFITGIVSTMIVQNASKGESVTFDTVSLIGFLFSVILGSASIVLAISAIWLGKISEEAMINRSDDSIRLQNNTFTKTIEALQRIEASTGVTEKRIEDIVGRVDDISRGVAERAFSDKLVSGKKQDLLQEEIKRSILNEFREKKAKTEIDYEKERERIDVTSRYGSFQKDLVVELVNSGILKAKKIGEGSTYGNREDLADAIFTKDNDKIGISMFSDEGYMGPAYSIRFPGFLEKSMSAISEGVFTKMFVVFNRTLSADSPFTQEFNKIKKIVRPDIACKIFLISGSLNVVKNDILKEIQ